LPGNLRQKGRVKPALPKTVIGLISLPAPFAFHIYSGADLDDLLSPERNCHHLNDVVGEGHALRHPQLEIILGKKVKMDRFIGLAAQNQSGRRLPSETLVSTGFNVPFVPFLLQLFHGR